jgi:lysyl-tRNA synthetase class 2
MRIAQSSHIQAHDYDHEGKVLTIQFTNGAIYNYHGVDPNTYYAFNQSSSPGSYFHSKIKGQFKTQAIAAGDVRRRNK